MKVPARARSGHHPGLEKASATDWAGHTMEVTRDGQVVWKIPFEMACIDRRQRSVLLDAPTLPQARSALHTHTEALIEAGR
jgi:hypothetical protein